MGEKIETLSEGYLLGNRFEIELNRALSKGGDEQIHIQSPKFRIEMNKKDYLKYALSVLAAEKKLKDIKRMP